MSDRPDRQRRAKGWLQRAAGSAKHAAEVLKDEFAKGRAGDESPVQALGPSASERLKGLLARFAPGPDVVAEPSDATPGDEAALDADVEAAEVTGLLRSVDWHQVSSSIKDSAAAQRMKDLAAQVDWAKAKPAAARVGTALIAAAASGQLGGLHGRTGAMVARTIIDQTGLAERVAAKVSADRAPSTRPIQAYIEATATETATGTADSAVFETQLHRLDRALGPASD